MTSITLPNFDIKNILRGYSNDGPLYDALASVQGHDDGEEISWSPADLRRRARRVLLELLKEEIIRYPSTVAKWEEYLPISITTDRLVRSSPGGSIKWSETYRRYGWLPQRYIGRIRQRSTDEVSLTTLAWVSDHLIKYLADIESLSPQLASQLREPINIMNKVVTQKLPDTESVPPDRLVLLALASSGYPWRNLSKAAELLLRAQQDSEYLAFALLKPEAQMEWRLFHLAAFASIVEALRFSGFRIKWRAPIGGLRPGPQIVAISPEGTPWDLWFEAAGARNFYRVSSSTYNSTVASIKGAGAPIGADVVFIHQGERALVLECKWSPKPQYVGRDGYHQIASYALDALNGLVGEVWAFIVGPAEIIPYPTVATEAWRAIPVVLGATSTTSLSVVVKAFLQRKPGLIKNWRIHTIKNPKDSEGSDD